MICISDKFCVQRLTFSGMCGLVERKRQNDVLRGNVNMDASHNSKLDVLNHTNYKMLMKFQWITEYFQPNLSDKNFAMSQISITVLKKTLSNSESEDLGTTLWDKFVTDNISEDDSKNLMLYRNTTKS